MTHAYANQICVGGRKAGAIYLCGSGDCERGFHFCSPPFCSARQIYAEERYKDKRKKISVCDFWKICPCALPLINRSLGCA